ncbi:TniQ family protein [Rhodanobacter umsongensis]|uniref:TniQ family protein n=1 Tax=Rhodanobacter umsongensis TaxID=633153 RepID=A0ABW0JQH7_9GAMM
MSDKSLFRPDTAFWSVLPPVPLMGVGTALVESVEHYVIRLAWITGTSVKSIVSLPAPFDEPGIRKTTLASSFCGPGKVYKRRIENLEILTGVETIRCGSFYLLDAILTPGAVGRASGYHRWCPQCYKEWDEATSWEPLQWSIDLRVTCPDHGCDLEDRCRHCGAIQKPSVRYQSRRNCSKCQRSLAGDGAWSVKPRYVSWAEGQLSKLVELCATPGRDPLPGTTFETFAYTITRSAPSNPALSVGASDALARLVRLNFPRGLPKGSGVRVRLHTLINACALQGISVQDLLLNPVESGALSFIERWGEYRPLELPSGHDEENVLVLASFLEALLANQKMFYLPHPRSAMRELKVTRRAVSTVSPDVYGRYMLRYQRQASSGALRRAEQAFLRALNCIKAIRPNPFGPSDGRKARKLVARTLDISVEDAWQMVRCITHWRRAIELAKAKVLGLSLQELRAQKKLGGIGEQWC